MSNLKHQTLPELLASRRHMINKIKYHGSQKSGAEQRLKWIDKYIAENEQKVWIDEAGSIPKETIEKIINKKKKEGK